VHGTETVVLGVVYSKFVACDAGNNSPEEVLTVGRTWHWAEGELWRRTLDRIFSARSDAAALL